MPRRTSRAERTAITRATRVVAEVYQLFRPVLFLPSRGGPDVAAARQVAQYLAHVVGQVPKCRIAETFRRHISTVTHAINLVEDMRDDPDFDALIATLEDKFNGPHQDDQA